MRTIPELLNQHLQGEEATTSICWAIERRDGVFIRGTEHDDDIELPEGSPSDDLSGIYYAGANITGSDNTASADMSVDNMEVTGAFSQDIQLTDLTVQQIESGLMNMAAVTVFLVNWKDPSFGYAILNRGYLGEINRDSDAKYTTEVRSLAQLLSQTIVQTYSERCNVVRLGDARCKIDIAPLTVVGTVTDAVGRQQFTVSGITTQPVDYFSSGIIRGLTGANATFERELKFDSFQNVQGRLKLWEAFPADVRVGDTFALEPGCDRLLATCRDKFDNILNHRAYGAFIPGVLKMQQGSGQ